MRYQHGLPLLYIITSVPRHYVALMGVLEVLGWMEGLDFWVFLLYMSVARPVSPRWIHSQTTKDFLMRRIIKHLFTHRCGSYCCN